MKPILIGASAVSAMTFRHPRRLDTNLVKFVPEDANIANEEIHDSTLLKFVDVDYKDFDPRKDILEDLSTRGIFIDPPVAEPADGVGAMRAFYSEKGFKGKDVVKSYVASGDAEVRASQLPFQLDDLKQEDEKPQKSVEEKADEVTEVSAVMLAHRSKEDLSGIDPSGVFIMFESNQNAEDEFNDKLSKDLNITRWGNDPFLNKEKNIPKFTYFPPKRPEDAEDAIQAINAIQDAGETAEDNLEADTAEAEAAEKEKAAVMLKYDVDTLSDPNYLANIEHHSIRSHYGLGVTTAIEQAI